MGLCLSCLGGNDDYEANERTSLLGNDNFSDEYLQENLIKQQKRQAELSVIVNDLTENLIDASSFLSKQTPAENTGSTESACHVSSATSPKLAPSASDDTKQLPYLWSSEQKIQLMNEMSASHETFEVHAPSKPLFVVF